MHKILRTQVYLRFYALNFNRNRSLVYFYFIPFQCTRVTFHIKLAPIKIMQSKTSLSNLLVLNYRTHVNTTRGLQKKIEFFMKLQLKNDIKRKSQHVFLGGGFYCSAGCIDAMTVCFHFIRKCKYLGKYIMADSESFSYNFYFS